MPFFRLPYRFIVPLPICRELSDFTLQEWRTLEDGGLKIYDLPGEEVGQALAFKQEYERLSINDCFALVVAIRQKDTILLTGDAQLRRSACICDVQVHGVIWIIDMLSTTGVCEKETLISALKVWQSDPTVRLPHVEIEKRLRSL